ncbi:MAG: helix-turn-helix domain-containing protein [Roseburia sp.]|nr:helix-turn-helix domain-containing protein [Roseburia sp.]
MDVKKIGKYIAIKRKEKGLTQEQLSEKLGVTNKTVSRWENGNYMPDLSLLEPLSRELSITLNELLAGENIEKEDICEHCEKNLADTVEYTAKKLNTEQKKHSFLFLGTGVILIICAFLFFPPESSWPSIYSILGAILFSIGLFRALKLKMLSKRLAVSICIFACILAVFHVIDYIGVIFYQKPPVYRYITETNDSAIVYHSLFYNVYRLNKDTPEEYYVVDSEKKYTLETISELQN